ncbi:MAG: hypothetical protein Q9220_006500 [cf. Caloplaca sp. 1 TL-2023]
MVTTTSADMPWSGGVFVGLGEGRGDEQFDPEQDDMMTGKRREMRGDERTRRIAELRPNHHPKGSLQRSLDTTAATGSYTCTTDSCPARFDNAAKLIKHRREAHRASPPRPMAAWDDHRDTIEQLYVKEDKSLPDVVLTMQRVHGFHATERQYRRRISAWDLDKNVKDDEMRAMIAMANARSQQGKRSVFFLRGRQVDEKKIDRFAQRKKVDRNGGLDATWTQKLPDHVRCITPTGDIPTAPEISNPLRKGKRKVDADNTTGKSSGMRVQDLQHRLGALAAALQADSAETSQVHDHDPPEHFQISQTLKELERMVDALTALISTQRHVRAGNSFKGTDATDLSTSSKRVKAVNESPHTAIHSKPAEASQMSLIPQGNASDHSNRTPQVDLTLDLHATPRTSEKEEPLSHLYQKQFVHTLRVLAKERTLETP